MSSRPLFAILALSLLAGCASLSNRELAYVQSRGVPASIMSKLERDDELTPRDLIVLSQRGVPDNLIIRALEGAGVDYLVTRADIVRMRRGGVSARVIDVLLLECEEFARSYAYSPVDVSVGMWWTSSPYYGPDHYYYW